MGQHYISFPREAEVRVRADGSPVPVAADRTVGRRRLLWGWTYAAVLYFAWEAVAYRGLFATAAEWQFNHLGQDFPTATFGLLLSLALAPAVAMLRRKDDEPDAIDPARDQAHLLFGIASALALATLATLLWTLTLPDDRGPLRDASIAQATLPEGAARLAGTIGYGRIASFSRGILFLRRHELYAPLVPQGRQDDVRVFVEFAGDERAEIRSGATLTNRTGILVRRDLPGALTRLYRLLGYRVASHHYVLYASAFTVRWPYYLAAFQLALGAFVLAMAGLGQLHHAGRRGRAAHAAI